MTKQMTKHSPSTEPMKMIMNPKTGKMVQAGGQLGKKIIRNYNADKIYNPLTGKQVLTGGSVGKKVLGLYKEGGTNLPPRPAPAQNTKVFECNDESQKMKVYLLFRQIKITPINCSSTMSTGTLKRNTCKTGNFKREWLPYITNGLTKIFPKTELNELMKNDTFWKELQQCYENGEKQYNKELEMFQKQHTYTFKINPTSLQQTPKLPQSPKSEKYKFNVLNSFNANVGTGTVVIITDFELQNRETQVVYKRTFTIDTIDPKTSIKQPNNTYENEVVSYNESKKFDDYEIQTKNEATFQQQKGLFPFEEKTLNNTTTTNTVQSASCEQLDTAKLNEYTKQLEELYKDMGSALKCVDNKTMDPENSAISDINAQINSVIVKIDKLDKKQEYTHEILRMMGRLVEKITGSQSGKPTLGSQSGGKKKIKKHKGKECRSK